MEEKTGVKYTKDKVVEMFLENEDMNGTELSEAMGVSRQYIARILSEAGYSLRQRNKDIQERYIDTLEPDFREYYSTGVTQREMEELLGVSAFWVRKLINRTGLNFRDLVKVRREELSETFKKYREEGMTVYDISKKTGYSRTHISTLLNLSGTDEEQE